MKKTIFVLTLALLMLTASIGVFADTNESILSKVTGLTDAKITELRNQGIGYGQLIPASVISKLSKTSIEDVIKERTNGKTYYKIAEEKGIKVEKYKDGLLEKKNAYVDEMKKSGTITEEQAKIMKDRFAQNIDKCDGSTIGAGRANGVGMGMGMGKHNNNGNMPDRGMGRGLGRGMGRGLGRGMGRVTAPGLNQAQ